MGTSGKCPERIGVHEPNLVLKDNDLTTKIRMKPEEAFEVIDALHKDSDALCQMVLVLFARYSRFLNSCCIGNYRLQFACWR